MVTVNHLQAIKWYHVRWAWKLNAFYYDFGVRQTTGSYFALSLVSAYAQKQTSRNLNCSSRHEYNWYTVGLLHISFCKRRAGFCRLCWIFLFIMSYITESAIHVFLSHVVIIRRLDQCKTPAGTLLNVSWKSPRNLFSWIYRPWMTISLMFNSVLNTW